jgi:hypothetical protein
MGVHCVWLQQPEVEACLHHGGEILKVGALLGCGSGKLSFVQMRLDGGNDGHHHHVKLLSKGKPRCGSKGANKYTSNLS